MKIVMSVAAIAGLIVSLNSNHRADSAFSLPLISGQLVETQVPDELKSNCYICHNPKAPSHDAIVAPPLAVVKMRYLRMYSSQDEFVSKMTAFLKSPTKETAIMYGAVDRFGLMPATTLDENTTRKIAEFIYSNKLEEPPWLSEEMGSRGLN